MRARVLVIPAVLLAALIGCGPKPTESTPTAPTGPPDADARELAKKRLKLVGFSLHSFHDTQKMFPAGVACQADKEHPTAVGLSWRVQLLPHLEQTGLYARFKLDEPWDSPSNKPLIDEMPDFYASPGKTAPAGHTYLQAFRGPQAFLKTPPDTTGRKPGWTVRGRRMTPDIADGTSRTLAVAEAAEPVIWTKPDDLEFDGKALPKLGGVFADGFHGVMVDGDVYFVPKELMSDDLLRALVTVNGGESYDLNPLRKASGLKEWEYAGPKPPPLPKANPPK